MVPYSTFLAKTVLITQMFWMLLNSAYTASKISLSQTDQRDVLFHVMWCSVIKVQRKDNGRKCFCYGASFLKEFLHVLRDPAFQEVAGGSPCLWGEINSSFFYFAYTCSLYSPS